MAHGSLAHQRRQSERLQRKQIFEGCLAENLKPERAFYLVRKRIEWLNDKIAWRKKLNALLTSIEDEAVREAVAKNTIVTGGSIASMLLREPVNDFLCLLRQKAVRVVARA